MPSATMEPYAALATLTRLSNGAKSLLTLPSYAWTDNSSKCRKAPARSSQWSTFQDGW